MGAGESRRDFLKLLGLGALAAPLPALSAAAPPMQAAGRRKKVLVLGAGLAGLSAALELRDAGHEVTVLEARQRAGGRVQTLRDPFADGLYAEAGAAQVFDNHDWTLKYTTKFGLALDRIVPSTLASVYHVRGARVVVKPGTRTDWPLELTAEERELDRAGMWKKYVVEALAEVGNTASANWPGEAQQPLDAVAFTAFLKQRGASPAAVALLRLGLADSAAESADSLSALCMLREVVHREERKDAFTIRGGSDQLPRAFASRLADCIRYGTVVTALERDERGVRAVCKRAGARESHAADYALCTLPFSVLRRVAVSPPFSLEKRAAIEKLRYTSVTRVYLQTRKRFWLEQGLSGYAATDLPVMGVYERSLNQPGPRGILESYRTGLRAREVAALPESERVKRTLAEMERVFSAVREHFEGGAAKCWDDDEHAHGAYTWYAPGEMRQLLPAVARPEGRVFFAGEHASTSPGWMQGALQSGNRAAREVHAAD